MTQDELGELVGSSDTPFDHGPGEMVQRVFQCLPLGLIVFDPQLNIIYHNPAASFIAAQHKSIAQALSSNTAESQYEDWHKELRETLQHESEHRWEQVLFLDPQRGERLLNLIGIPLSSSDNQNITGGILVIEDVTDFAGLEKRLAVSERMSAVGKLAARVAHELNNPLDGILRYMNLALRAQEKGNTEKINQYLQQARTGLIRMTEIIKELVNFSRNTYGSFDDTSINTVVDEAVKVMSDKARTNGVSIICDLNENVPAVRGPNLFQVFCNLIKNAVDAMPEGGNLTITTRVDDHQVLIRFQDTGIGLPDPIHNIWEPFFTTKEPGKGTGLGLPICKDIVEKYNGKIIAENGPKKGCIFTIRIPIDSCSIIKNPSGDGTHTARPMSGARFTSSPKEQSS
jgi:signal transduction histidine kinase